MRSKYNKAKAANDDIGRESALRGSSGLSGSSRHTQSLTGAKSMRYSLRQYEDLISHMWRHSLDTEQKNEVSETKFVRFLRENKILTEKKQLDEMFKQCIFQKKSEELNMGSSSIAIKIGSSISYTMYQRLFMRPLMLLGMENALTLIEEY